jgi:hypothetical protein
MTAALVLIGSCGKPTMGSLRTRALYLLSTGLHLLAKNRRRAMRHARRTLGVGFGVGFALVGVCFISDVYLQLPELVCEDQDLLAGKFFSSSLHSIGGIQLEKMLIGNLSVLFSLSFPSGW